MVSVLRGSKISSLLTVPPGQQTPSSPKGGDGVGSTGLSGYLPSGGIVGFSSIVDPDNFLRVGGDGYKTVGRKTHSSGRGDNADAAGPSVVKSKASKTSTQVESIVIRTVEVVNTDQNVSRKDIISAFAAVIPLKKTVAVVKQATSWQITFDKVETAVSLENNIKIGTKSFEVRRMAEKGRDGNIRWVSPTGNENSLVAILH